MLTPIHFHLDNAKKMAENLMRCPANEQCMPAMMEYTSQAIEDIVYVLRAIVREIEK